MKNRKEFSNEREDELEAITMDSGKTAAVFEAMKTTIGETTLIFLINSTKIFFLQEWTFHRSI